MIPRSMKRCLATALLLLGLSTLPQSCFAGTVEQWGIFETALTGPATGDPFTDVQLSAVFSHGDHSVTVTGFYDGAGVYRIRFMPDQPGPWTFTTQSNRPELSNKTGAFTASPPSAGNHGPVRVRDSAGFVYADGTPYREIGTTCYAWAHQDDALEEQTLQTLSAAPFNKLRMCIFPKYYHYNQVEPIFYPFEGTPPNKWNFTRFNPAFFQHMEKRIGQLNDLGIQADLILFHPYDGQWSTTAHWGFDRMGADNDDRYLRYVLARFGAYRNVWWSLANEWDFVKTKQVADWDRFGAIIQTSDPYHHLCSIHNGAKLFDHTKPWITHVSLQNDRPEDAEKYLDQYKKPVIYDECRYEGNLPQDWGDITAERMVGSFWKALVTGAWCGHGETYLDPHDIIWWSKGGVLHGQSPARLAFFKKIIDSAPAAARAPLKIRYSWGVEGEYYLVYFWDRQPGLYDVDLPNDIRFKAEVIDTWNMNVTPLDGEFTGHCEIPLPTKPWQALRLIKTN